MDADDSAHLKHHHRNTDLSCCAAALVVTHTPSFGWDEFKLLSLQVVNRDKLQRAGEDNLFVRLLYAKDQAQAPKNQDEQEKLGGHSIRFARAGYLCVSPGLQGYVAE